MKVLIVSECSVRECCVRVPVDSVDYMDYLQDISPSVIKHVTAYDAGSTGPVPAQLHAPVAVVDAFYIKSNQKSGHSLRI